MSPPSRPGLAAADFTRLPPPPFNPAIRISQAVAWFGGRLYVGGGRGPLREGLLREAEDARLGAEIACWDPAEAAWRRVHESPPDAAGTARDRSVRAFAAFRAEGDAAPALYAAVGSMTGQVVLLRSADGMRFEECGPPGLGQGESDIAALRSLCVLEGRLFTSPVGKNRGRGWADDNVADLPAVLATADPARGWQRVSDPGFGDPENESLNELAVFDGRLYAATLNRRAGFQLWKSAPGGDGPWSLVLERGAFRGPASPVPAAMQVFDGALYIGTGVQRQPGEGTDRFGPVAPELIRVWPDDRWELVAGESRPTPQGLRQPVSGRGPGFGDPFVQTFWRMAVHEGRLYVGGSDWRFWPTYLPRGRRARDDISAVMQDWLRAETEAWRGDYGLWSSADGRDWQTVTASGLGGTPAHYGIRELLSTPEGLIAVPAASRGEAAGGGVEVWCGRRGPAA